jgi:TolB protein
MRARRHKGAWPVLQATGWSGRLGRRSISLVGGLALAWASAMASAAGTDELLFMSNRGGLFEYYRMSADSSNARRLLAERGEAERLKLSPQGDRVVYAAARAGQQQQIFVTRLTDGQTWQITRHGAPNLEPAWSPDGQTVVFVSMRDGQRKLFLVGADGRHERRLTARDDLDELAPSFSPDGKQVAFLAGSAQYATRVSLVSVADGAVRQLSQATERSIEGAPVWAAGGQSLVFNQKAGPGAQLVVMPVDGSRRVVLTPEDARSGQPQSSPDGRQLLYLAVAPGQARQGLYLMDADGSRARKLYGGDFDVMDASWSGDGSRIYFAEQLDVGGQIFSIQADGSDLRRHSGGEGFDFSVVVCCNKSVTQTVSAAAAP